MKVTELASKGTVKVFITTAIGCLKTKHASSSFRTQSRILWFTSGPHLQILWLFWLMLTNAYRWEICPEIPIILNLFWVSSDCGVPSRVHRNGTPFMLVLKLNHSQSESRLLIPDSITRNTQLFNAAPQSSDAETFIQCLLVAFIYFHWFFLLSRLQVYKTSLWLNLLNRASLKLL